MTLFIAMGPHDILGSERSPTESGHAYQNVTVRSESPVSAKTAVGSDPGAIRIHTAESSDNSGGKVRQPEESIIETEPRNRNDGVPVGTLHRDGVDADAILELAEDIIKGKYENIDSLLIVHEGALVFESYYRNSHPDIPHYQMSITKSVTSFCLGRAMKMGYLNMADLNRPVVDFLEEVDRGKLAPGASTITISDCLNMHSGIRIPQEKLNDAQHDQGALKGQAQAQIFLGLTEPVTKASKKFKYQAIDSSLVMQVIGAVVPGPVGEFVAREYLGKLGITDYSWPEDANGLPQSHAGMKMRSHDMLKIGMLAAQNGKWQGEQLIPEEFVMKALSPIYRNNAGDSYGYFWLGRDYELHGKTYPSTTCRGAGGQLIFLISDADLIIVVTSDTEGQRSLDIPMLGFVPQVILPAFIGNQVVPDNVHSTTSRKKT